MMTKIFVGIVNQMQGELSSARKLGIPWDVKIFCPEPLFFDGHVRLSSLRMKSWQRTGKIINWIWIRLQYYRWILNNHNNYDAILIRYSSYDPLQLALAIILRNKLFTVHHTLETTELKSLGSTRSFIQEKLEAALGALTLSLVKGIIGVTNEISLYERNRVLTQSIKPTLTYPNGIDYNDHHETNIDVNRDISIPPALLFVASEFYSWQGLDLILESICESSEEFSLHVVGFVDDNLRERFKDSRVIFHGMLDSVQIDIIAKQCTVGIATLALERKGMRDACPLKVREYLRAGLPVYAGYQDIFPEDFPYFSIGPANIDNIVAYARKVSGVDRREVFLSSRKYIDKGFILSRLHEEISELHMQAN